MDSSVNHLKERRRRRREKEKWKSLLPASRCFSFISFFPSLPFFFCFFFFFFFSLLIEPSHALLLPALPMIEREER
jgi:hypothetical protein